MTWKRVTKGISYLKEKRKKRKSEKLFILHGKRKKAKPCILMFENRTGIWEHERYTGLARGECFLFFQCSQITKASYNTVIHGFAFFI